MLLVLRGHKRWETKCQPSLLLFGNEKGDFGNPASLQSEGAVETLRSPTPGHRNQAHYWCSSWSQWLPVSLGQFSAGSYLKCKDINPLFKGKQNPERSWGKSYLRLKTKITLNQDAILTFWWKNVRRDFYDNWKLFHYLLTKITTSNT